MLIQEEVWKDIKGYEGYYAISNLGRVKSKERTTIRRNGRNYSYKEKFLEPSICKKFPNNSVLALSKSGVVKIKTYSTLLKKHFGKKYRIVNINTELYLPKEGEVFKDIPGHEGKYVISNYGTVRSIKRVTNRVDGPNRRVSEKLLAHNWLHICLSNSSNGKVYNTTTSIPKALMSAFYTEFNPELHYVKKVSDDSTTPLHNYQYFRRLQHNPVIVIDLQGNYKRYSNYKEFKGETDLLKLFYRGSEIRYDNVNIRSITFDHPVYYKGVMKLSSFIIDPRKTKKV